MPMAIDLEKIVQSVSQVKLHGGVVGKVCKVLMVVAVSLAAIALSVRVLWVSVLTAVFVFVISFVMLWRLISFADKNPQAALLEGAEFLVHEQMKLGTKNTPELPVGELQNKTSPQGLIASQSELGKPADNSPDVEGDN